MKKLFLIWHLVAVFPQSRSFLLEKKITAFVECRGPKTTSENGPENCHVRSSSPLLATSRHNAPSSTTTSTRTTKKDRIHLLSHRESTTTTRRDAIVRACSVAVMLAGSSARAAVVPLTVVDTALTSSEGLLESRVTENLMSSPTYGMEGSDIFYPLYFGGVWNVTSVGRTVEAPCGVSLFGGENAYNAAQREIGEEAALRYRARFLLSDETCIADREFNVREIVKSAMGTNSVVDVGLATPDRFSCLLAPTGASTMFAVDMISLARRQEGGKAAVASQVRPTTTYNESFAASEVVRQIIAQRSGSGAGAGAGFAPTSSTPPPRLKEIETISLYKPTISKTGDITEIKCVQRSATYLVPSQTDPMAYKMWEATRGRPIDVRTYDVTYTKRK